MAARCDQLSRGGSCRERRGRTVQPIRCGGERSGYGNLGPIEDTSIEDFRAQIDTNLFGPIYLSKAAIPIMRVQGSGHILNFSSVGGRIGSTGRAPYSAAKFGVEGFSEVMVTELAPLGVKVTIFEPGGFRTDFAGSSRRSTKSARNTTPPSAKRHGSGATTTANNPAIRPGRPK